MSELAIRRRGWRVECQLPVVNNPDGVYVARVLDGHEEGRPQLGLGMSARSMEAAIAEAYRSACETVAARPGQSSDY
jgi:hypothetical protein